LAAGWRSGAGLPKSGGDAARFISMAKVTNTNRELVTGPWIPVTTKHLQIEVGGKVESIEYPAYQQSKPFILQILGSLQQ
jgi:hypothetical protein